MKTVLSIDGGGIRGIIPASILRRIEDGVGKPASEIFDLIAGTSTGGILALGLAKPGADGKPQYKAGDLLALYRDRGQEIFDRSVWRKIGSAGGLADEKYSHEPLAEIVQEYFQSTTLDNALCNVLISSYDIERRKPHFFKSWNDKASGWPMWRVARATSAAPTYFEPTDPADFQHGGEGYALVDGGVFVNNPAMCAFAEARAKFGPAEEILLVSLGTGELTRKLPYDDAKDWGLAGWALPVLSVVFDGVSDAVDYQLRQILGGKFHRFQCSLDIASDDMDDASEKNILNLMRQADDLESDKSAELEKVIAALKALNP